MGWIDVIKKFKDPNMPLTQREALAICNCFSKEELEIPAGMGYYEDNSVWATNLLNKEFPEFKWRSIIAHDFERTRTVLTVLDPDPREYHEMNKYGSWYNDGDYVRYDKKDFDEILRKLGIY